MTPNTLYLGDNLTVMRSFADECADRGIDGEFTWVDGKGDVQRCIISVKSGNTSVAHVRDLVGTVQRERAAMGLLVTLQQPTGPMINEAAGADRYRHEGLNTQKEFQRIQVVTIESLLDGPGPDLPRWRENPYKTARAIETVDQAGFDFDGRVRRGCVVSSRRCAVGSSSAMGNRENAT